MDKYTVVIHSWIGEEVQHSSQYGVYDSLEEAEAIADTLIFTEDYSPEDITVEKEAC